MLCNECRFWKNYGEGHGICNRADVIRSEGAIPTSALTVQVYVADDSGLDVNLVTRFNFGCVLAARRRK